jgi:hypothetical protein
LFEESFADIPEAHDGLFFIVEWQWLEKQLDIDNLYVFLAEV